MQQEARYRQVVTLTAKTQQVHMAEAYSLKIVLGNIELNTTKSNDKMSVIIPKFTCHTALVLEY